MKNPSVLKEHELTVSEKLHRITAFWDGAAFQRGEVLYFFSQPLAAEVSFRRKPQSALAVPDSKAAPASSIASPLNC
jgi:hypothetical protein